MVTKTDLTMATSTQNVLTYGYGGKFAGQFILRYYGGRSVMSAVHDYSRKVWSQPQKDGRRKFKRAVLWAKEQLKDDVKRKHYRKRARGAQTATNVAISDYMKNLRVREVDCTSYHGACGDSIRITLKNPLAVSRVRVYILGRGGVTIATTEPNNAEGGATLICKPRPDDHAAQPVCLRVELIRGPVALSETFQLPVGFQ